MARFNFEVDDALHADVKAAADAEGISMQAWHVRAARRELVSGEQEEEQCRRLDALEERVTRIEQIVIRADRQ